MQRTPVYPESAKLTVLVYGLILSIAIFFGGMFIAYVVRFVGSGSEIPRQALPPVLWVSTVVLLTGSHLLRRAWKQVRRERQRPFRRYLLASLLLALIFCVLQTFGMAQLLRLHSRMAIESSAGTAAVYLMILLHMLHFVCGVIGLAFVTSQAYLGRYDHEYHNGVRLAAVYWRFLDVIWLLMLVLFWCSGQA